MPRPWRQQVPAAKCHDMPDGSRCDRGRQDRDRNSEQRPQPTPRGPSANNRAPDRDRRGPLSQDRANLRDQLTRGCNLSEERGPGHLEQGKGRPTTRDREADREAGR